MQARQSARSRIHATLGVVAVREHARLKLERLSVVIQGSAAAMAAVTKRSDRIRCIGVGDFGPILRPSPPLYFTGVPAARCPEQRVVVVGVQVAVRSGSAQCAGVYSVL